MTLQDVPKEPASRRRLHELIPGRTLDGVVRPAGTVREQDGDLTGVGVIPATLDAGGTSEAVGKLGVGHCESQTGWYFPVVALLRISTPRPLFFCSGCAQRKPAMLKDNDSLGDPRDMAKAHSRSTGHSPILLGGMTPPNVRGVLLVHANVVKCLWCVDQGYLAYENRIEVCRCVELSAGTPATRPAR